MNLGRQDAGIRAVPVVLAGGAGTRLWPLSTKQFPKQFHTLAPSDCSLLQACFARALALDSMHAPLVLSQQSLRLLIEQQLSQFEQEYTLIAEPCACNTAPAMLVAAHWVAQRFSPETLMLFLPADHQITPQEAFAAAVNEAVERCAPDGITLFGVQPAHAHTGYGYIHCPDAAKGDVLGFTEKPDEQTAEGFVASGDYYWNCGIFLATAGCIMRQMRRYDTALSALCEKALARAAIDGHCLQLDAASYAICPSISFDYAVCERATRLRMQPMQADWSDMGSWQSVHQRAAQDALGNAHTGQAVFDDAAQCYVHNNSAVPITISGLNQIAVVATDAAILVTALQPFSRQQPQRVDISAARTAPMQRVMKPWGHFEWLHQSPYCHIKRLCVEVGACISLQQHQHRSEHWVVLEGLADVTLGDTVQRLMPNDSILIPIGALHRLANAGASPLVVLEVQTGSTLCERDIIRYEDMYGRLAQEVA